LGKKSHCKHRTQNSEENRKVERKKRTIRRIDGGKKKSLGVENVSRGEGDEGKVKLHCGPIKERPTVPWNLKTKPWKTAGKKSRPGGLKKGSGKKRTGGSGGSIMKNERRERERGKKL